MRTLCILLRFTCASCRIVTWNRDLTGGRICPLHSGLLVLAMGPDESEPAALLAPQVAPWARPPEESSLSVISQPTAISSVTTQVGAGAALLAKLSDAAYDAVQAHRELQTSLGRLESALPTPTISALVSNSKILTPAVCQHCCQRASCQTPARSQHQRHRVSEFRSSLSSACQIRVARTHCFSALQSRKMLFQLTRKQPPKMDEPLTPPTPACSSCSSSSETPSVQHCSSPTKTIILRTMDDFIL